MSIGSLPQVPGYLIHSGFRRWSVDEYHRLIDTGFLAEDDPVHLLEGNMVLRMPPNPRHSNTVTTSIRVLVKVLPDVWQLRSEQPITLADSEPQPDVPVYATRTDYRSGDAVPLVVDRQLVARLPVDDLPG
jgi:Putative restriction endonuclease